MVEDQKDVFRDKADDIFEQLLIDPDMEKIAKANNIEIKTSGFFSMERPNLTLGWSYDLLNRIFKMELKEVNEPIESDNSISIVQIKEKRDAYIPEYTDVKDKAQSAVAAELAKEIAREKAEEQLVLIKEVLGSTKIENFPKIAQDLGLDIHQTPVFNRDQYLPQIGISKDFQEAAFSLTDTSKLSGVVGVANGYCVLYLDNYIPIDEKEYTSVKDELAQSISKEKQNIVFGDFVAQLRIESGLIDNIPELRNLTQ